MRSYRLKPLEEMDLIDDFLNNAVASNKEIGEEVYRTILEVLLGKKLGTINVKNQVPIFPDTPDLRGVRLDVEINETDEGSNKVTVYDYEPHTTRNMDFALANRYRQARIDSKVMKSGDAEFTHMPYLYIITITNFDIWGEDSMAYTAKVTFEEFPEKEYGDRLKFVYFNTKGTTHGSAAIKNMLTYIQTSNSANAVDEATTKVNSLVTSIKNLEEVRAGYMTFYDKYKLMIEADRDGIMEEGREEGRAEGRAEGKAETREEILVKMLDAEISVTQIIACGYTQAEIDSIQMS